jgi:hypothetical protein
LHATWWHCAQLESFGYRVFVTTGFYVSLIFSPLFQLFVLILFF